MARNLRETIRQAMQDVVVPQLEQLRSEIEAIRTDLRRIDDKLTTTLGGMRSFEPGFEG